MTAKAARELANRAESHVKYLRKQLGSAMAMADELQRLAREAERLEAAK